MSWIVNLPRLYSFDKEVYDCPILCLRHISSFFSMDYFPFTLLQLTSTSELSDGLDAMFEIIMYEKEFFDQSKRENFLTNQRGSVDGTFG